MALLYQCYNYIVITRKWVQMLEKCSLTCVCELKVRCFCKPELLYTKSVGEPLWKGKILHGVVQLVTQLKDLKSIIAMLLFLGPPQHYFILLVCVYVEEFLSLLFSAKAIKVTLPLLNS